MGQNQMTLQLSASALQKLIELEGGDEFILSLRKGTIENVLKSRVKALSADPLVKGLEAQIAAEVKNQIGEITKSSYFSSPTVTLQPEFLADIQRRANELVNAKVIEVKGETTRKANEVADEAVKKLIPYVEKYINQRMDTAIAEYINTEVKRRFEIALKG